MKEAVDEYYIEDFKVKSLDNWLDNNDDDGLIYEVIKVINSKPLFYEEHYKRMKNSFHLKKVDLKLDEQELLELIKILVNKNNKQNGNIKITYSIKKKVLKLFFIKHTYPTKEMYKEGVKAIFYCGQRDNPNAKVINSKFRDDISNEMKKRNAYEALLINKDGIISEGSRSNVFFIKDNVIETPYREKVLPGVTRTEIIKEAEEIGIVIVENKIEIAKIEAYDAAFISGTSPNILPLRSIERKEFDVNNSVLRRIMVNFDKRIERYIKS